MPLVRTRDCCKGEMRVGDWGPVQISPGVKTEPPGRRSPACQALIPMALSKTPKKRLFTGSRFLGFINSGFAGGTARVPPAGGSLSGAVGAGVSGHARSHEERGPSLTQAFLAKLPVLPGLQEPRVMPWVTQGSRLHSHPCPTPELSLFDQFFAAKFYSLLFMSCKLHPVKCMGLKCTV